MPPSSSDGALGPPQPWRRGGHVTWRIHVLNQRRNRMSLQGAAVYNPPSWLCCSDRVETQTAVCKPPFLGLLRRQRESKVAASCLRVECCPVPFDHHPFRMPALSKEDKLRLLTI